MSSQALAAGMSAVKDDTKLECRICWHVYDPAEGDAMDQIEPGTPFLQLPPYWRCPQCDAEKSGFLPLVAEPE